MEYRKKTFNKGEITIDTDDLQGVTMLCIESLKRHGTKTAIYGINELDRFFNDAISYFEMLKDCNEDIEDNKQLYPSIEGLCLHLGISRQILSRYSTRNAEWESAISQIRNAIATCKVQLASHGRIPPLIHIFDLTNNHSYYNTNQFVLSAEPKQDTETTPRISMAELKAVAELPELPPDEEKGLSNELHKEQF